MNLKEQFKRIGGKRLNEDMAWERKFGQPLPTLKDVAAKHRTNEQEGHPSVFDYKYFIEQVEGLIETLEEFEQEIGTQLEMKADETGEPFWKQAENQTSRYIMGAHKQLEGLLKKLQTGESRVSPGTYRIPGA